MNIEVTVGIILFALLLCGILYLWLTVRLLSTQMGRIGRQAEDADIYVNQLDASLGDVGVDLKLATEGLTNQLNELRQKIEYIDGDLNKRVVNLEEISGNLEDVHSVMEDVKSIAGAYKEQRELLNMLKNEVEAISRGMNAG